MKKENITALCLTYNRFDSFKNSILSFENQTFEAKKILIVNSGNYIYQCQTRQFLETKNIDWKQIDCNRQPSDKIGDLRNIALYNIDSDYIMTWDDDDISSNDRMQIQYDAMISNKADICTLKCFTLNNVFPNHSFKVKSINKYGLEPTVLFRNPKGGLRYMSINNKEDTLFIENLESQLKYNIFVLDNENRCDLYHYNYHGNNICGHSHFQNMLRFNEILK